MSQRVSINSCPIVLCLCWRVGSVRKLHGVCLCSKEASQRQSKGYWSPRGFCIIHDNARITWLIGWLFPIVFLLSWKFTTPHRNATHTPPPSIILPCHFSKGNRNVKFRQRNLSPTTCHAKYFVASQMFGPHLPKFSFSQQVITYIYTFFAVIFSRFSPYKNIYFIFRS